MKKTVTPRKYDSIMNDAMRMAEHSGIVRPETLQLWFGEHMAASGTLAFARNVRRASATACLISGKGFPAGMDAFTMERMVGL